MSTLMTIPYKKRDPFTELWLCNPALGLGKPERVPEQPEDSPEPPVKGLITGPSSRQVPSFGPCSALRAPRSRLLLPGTGGNYSTAHVSAKPTAWISAIPFQTSDLAAFYPLRFKFNIIFIVFQRTCYGFMPRHMPWYMAWWCGLGTGFGARSNCLLYIPRALLALSLFFRLVVLVK